MDKVQKGDAITAQKQNEIIDAINVIQGQMTTPDGSHIATKNGNAFRASRPLSVLKIITEAEIGRAHV